MVVVKEYEPMGKGKYRAVFDNGVSCVLYRSEAARFSLKTGSFLNEEQYSTLIEEIIGKRAKRRAMHILEQMDRTEHELREKLTKSEYPEECTDAAIEYVKKYKYIDDERYAFNYVRFHQEKLSKQQLTVKLSQKGVNKELITAALESEYEADDEEKIRTLLEKKHYDYEKMDRKECNRVYQYILRRGFKSNDILKVMRGFSENCTIY